MARHDPADLETLKAALMERLEELAEAVLGPPNAASRCRTEWTWGSKCSRKLVVRGANRGAFYSHETAAGGGPLDLIADGLGCSIRDAIIFARKWTGLDTNGAEAQAMLAAARADRGRQHSARTAEDEEDRATRVRNARKLWAEAVPLRPDDAGWTYLAAHRRIPADAIAEAARAGVLRFHRARCALVAVATDDAGEVRAVQLVHLQHDGTKRPHEHDRPTKQTLGVTEGAAVRLPGERSALLLAEGPETGLSVWAATGRETWIALGSIAKIQPPLLRRLVACVDDDPRHAPATKTLRKALDRWHAEARDVVVALPWPCQRFDKSDFNDLLRQDGLAAVRARIDEADTDLLEVSPDGAELTQDGTAWAFAKAVHGRFLYDHTDGRWFRFNGSRWALDSTSRAFHTARVFCRKLRDAAADAPADMAKIGFVANVERAARSDPRLAVSDEVWDADRWLLSVPGGAVDLRTGELLPPDPRRFCRRQTAVAPAEPDTPAPLWQAFLDDATRSDKQLQAFLQRLAGYVLTGDVTEEVMVFFYGPGGNGKGVFIGALTAILNEYAVSVPIEVFTAGSRLNLEYYRAQMAGARLVTASETEAGATWSESLIKELTGNEAPLSARSPYGRPFTFRPQFKLLLVGNHAPRLKARTPAMERRLRVVPFDNTPTNPDPDLKDKLRAEYPAILRWMLDGCATWQRERIGTADAIRQATAGYFEAQDVFRCWLEERCTLHPNMSERPGRVQADYAEYLRESGEPPASASEFRELLERTKGVKYAKIKGTPWVKGLGLKPHKTARGSDD
jgi:putative DNA primase/helicase